MLKLQQKNIRTDPFFPALPNHDIALKAERCRRSLYEFTKEFWDLVVPKKYIDNWHIQCVCEHLQAVTNNQIYKLIINIPPGSAKSTLISVMWPAWEWIDHSGEQSLFGSFDEALAIRDSVKCRIVFDSYEYRDMFQPKWKMSRDQNAKGFYTNTHNGNRYTFGLNSKGKTGWRGDKVVIDDPNDVKERFNPIAKANAFDVFSSVLSTRVNDLENPKFLIVQQRVAYDDYTGKLMERDGWEVVTIPADFDPSTKFFTSIGWSDPRTEVDENFFPKRYPDAALKEMRTVILGEEGYSAQFNQKPFPAGGSRFNSENFCYYEDFGHNMIRLYRRSGISPVLKLDLCWTFVTVDFAASEKKSADWTVFSVWAVTQDFELLLLKVYRDRLSEPKIVELAEKIYSPVGYNGKKHSCFVVEANGLGLPISQAMASRGLPVIDVHIHQTDKLVRSATAAIRVENGQIYFPKHGPQYPWLKDFEKELTEFPMGSHDDQVDTLSLAAEAVYMVGIIGLTKPTNLTQEQKQAYQIMEDRGMNPQNSNMNKRFFKG